MRTLFFSLLLLCCGYSPGQEIEELEIGTVHVCLATRQYEYWTGFEIKKTVICED